MMERRHPIELYAIELERARSTLSGLASSRVALASEISNAAVRVKELEVRLTTARLAQAEYHLGSLKARLSYLEARAARQDEAARSEAQELAWTREALPANSATVSKLGQDLARLRDELRSLLAQTAA
jgi:hypothetical protein